MPSPQLEDGYLRIANELFEALLMYPFSKRQQAILSLIIRMSYGFQRKRAYIKAHKFFAVCGVEQRKVWSELRKLKALNVIDWDAETKEYWINKDYKSWLFPDLPNGITEMLKELTQDNMNHRQNGGKNDADKSSHRQNGGKNTTKMAVESPPKWWQEKPDRARGSKADQPPKESKESKDKKKKKATSATEVFLNPEQEQTLTILSEFLNITANDRTWIKRIGDQFPRVDLADVAWQLSMWFQENPHELNKPKSNPRSRFRNWVQRADGREEWRKPTKPSQRVRTQEENEADRRIKEALSQ